MKTLPDVCNNASVVADHFKRREHRKHLLASALHDISDQLAELGAIRVIVFGSYAADMVGSTSDLDIIAVMPSTRTGKEWRRYIPDAVEREIACDILVYTEPELVETLPVSSFLRHAVSTGKTVYEKRP